MLTTSIVSPSMIEKMANSGNPWIYLAGIFMVAFALIAKRIYGDMKMDKEKADKKAFEREDRLIKIDEKNRKESKDREQILMGQINSTIRMLGENTKTIQDLSQVVNKISESQEMLQQNQREIVEAVHNLNFEFRDIRNRIETIEKEFKQ